MATKLTTAQRKMKKAALDFRYTALENLYKAYNALVKGGVQSYMIDDRQLTRFDLPKLLDNIQELEEEIAKLEDELDGNRARRAFGVIPLDT